MFSLFPSTYSHPRTPPYSGYDYPYASRDYMYALAQERANERREARYRAYLAEARRRKAYQDQLARAEATRRRDHLFFGDFDDDSESYASFLTPPHYSQPRYLRTRGYRDTSSSPRSPQTSDEQSEHLSHQLAAGTEQSGHLENDSTPESSHANESTYQKLDHENRQAPSTTTNHESREAAARTIQAFIRSHLPRLHAFRAIADISRQFEDVRATFQFPSTLDFAASPSASGSDASDVPTLLYTPNNAPLHGHEHTIVKLLSELDAVESHGDARIRSARKALVMRMESELFALDTKKAEMWGELISKAPREIREDHDSPGTESPKEVIDSGYVSEDSSLVRSELADDMASCIVDEDAVPQS